MAAEQKQEQKDKKKSPEQEKPKKAPPMKEQETESLVRILGYDIRGSRNLYTGLTKIKGVSWAISNAVCLQLGVDRTKKIGVLSKDEVKQIEDALRNVKIADFMKNRRVDPETGETKHFYGTDLDMKRDFDIRRLKKIRSYRGIRHTAGQPVRGQRTRSHFRKKGRTAVGVKRKK